MRFVEFSPRAEAGRTAAPVARRHQINRAIRAIAARPDWGASPTRFLAPGGVNTGLIVELAVCGWAIVYRVRSTDDAIWVEDIRELMIG